MTQPQETQVDQPHQVELIEPDTQTRMLFWQAMSMPWYRNAWARPAEIQMSHAEWSEIKTVIDPSPVL